MHIFSKNLLLDFSGSGSNKNGNFLFGYYDDGSNINSLVIYKYDPSYITCYHSASSGVNQTATASLTPLDRSIYNFAYYPFKYAYSDSFDTGASILYLLKNGTIVRNPVNSSYSSRAVTIPAGTSGMDEPIFAYKNYSKTTDYDYYSIITKSGKIFFLNIKRAAYGTTYTLTNSNKTVDIQTASLVPINTTYIDSDSNVRNYAIHYMKNDALWYSYISAGTVTEGTVLS